MTTTPGFLPPTHGTDPFGRTKFRVVWDSAEIHGISSISPLEMTLVTAGSTSGTSVGRPAGPEVTRWVVSSVELTRPRTTDRAFEAWVQTPVEKIVLVELFGLAGGPGLTFRLAPCVPVAYMPLDAVDAASSGVALERLTISCASIETIPGEPAKTM